MHSSLDDRSLSTHLRASPPSNEVCNTARLHGPPCRNVAKSSAFTEACVSGAGSAYVVSKEEMEIQLQQQSDLTRDVVMQESVGPLQGAHVAQGGPIFHRLDEGEDSPESSPPTDPADDYMPPSLLLTGLSELTSYMPQLTSSWNSWFPTFRWEMAFSQYSVCPSGGYDMVEILSLFRGRSMELKRILHLQPHSRQSRIICQCMGNLQMKRWIPLLIIPFLSFSMAMLLLPLLLHSSFSVMGFPLQFFLPCRTR